MKWKTLYRYLLMLGVISVAGMGIASAQTHSVHGRVTGENESQGLAGVAVTVEGTTKGTTTDDNGNYKLTGLSANSVLIFSNIGYKKESVAVKGRSEVNFRLQPDVSNLEQVVVIGYGTAKKKDLTGAVASVKASQLENEHPASVQDLLRANVPGLNIGLATSPKGDAALQVRGKNTLNASSSPLVVLDGTIYYGALADINPNDIETIDVLKDASSAAVYGAKAASGVIQVTTKKGKTGKPVVNVNASTGLATMSVDQPVYNANDFLNVWRRNVKYSTNLNAKPYQYDDPRALPSNVSLQDWLAYDASAPNSDPVVIWLQRLGLQPVEVANYKKGVSQNWYDMVFQNGLRQDYNLSLSGRKDGLSYFWSVGYMDNKGIVTNDEYNVARTRLNLEAKVTNFLSVGTNTQFSVRDESAVPFDWTVISPNSPWGSVYKDDSSDYRYIPNDEASGGKVPFTAPKYTDRLKRYYSLNSNIYAKVALPFGIKYQVNFTPRFEWFKFYQAQNSAYQEWAPLGGLATRQDRQTYQWQVDNLINWSRDFGRHHLDVTLLANAEKYQVWRSYMNNNGFSPSDVLGYHNMASGINPSIGNTGDYNDETGTLGDEVGTANALMARLFYSYKDRYMLTATVRRDGYSAFGQAEPYATFPSAALGWVFTNESFMKTNWLNYGKLRVSYGLNGNRDIGRYSALADLTTSKYLHVLQNGSVQQVTQLNVNDMPNPKLKWEQTASFNVGLDFTVLKNRVDGSIDVYKSSTTNLLAKRTLPDVTGFTSVWTNIGQVDNKGIEINLNTRNIQRNNFTWNTSANFSLNRNEIVHLYGNQVAIKDANGKVIGYKEGDDAVNKWFIGHSLDAVWDQRVMGVWQTPDSAQAKKYGVYPGDFHVKDVNNDGKYTDADREFLGFKEPRFRWTLRNEFTFYKNFTFSFLVYSYWGQMNAFDQAKNRSAAFPDRVNSYTFPFWTPQNPVNDYARLASSDGGASYSVYKKSSFIRLDNISFGYNIPKTFLKKISVQDAKFYFTIKNAAVYSPSWSYWDPEPSSGPTFGPTPRIYTAGINVTL